MNGSKMEFGQESQGANRIRYRLVHVIYLVTLLSSALATFGTFGLVSAILVFGFWLFVFNSRERPVALIAASLCYFIVGICMTFPISPARGTASRFQCSANLKNLVFATQGYHDAFGVFPPAYIADDDGKPMHSWRVLILPFLDCKGLYDQYNFDEPWNGPNNIKLANRMPRSYRCPSNSFQHRNSQTSYVAVVGPRTAWPNELSRSNREIKDAKSSTILLVEHDGGIPWLEPRDLKYDEAVPLVSSKDPIVSGSHRYETFFYQYYTGRSVGFVDGSVWFLYRGIPQNVWSTLLCCDDGSVSEDVSNPELSGMKILKLGNCVRLGIFVILTLIPLGWVWVKPTSRK